MRRHISVVSLGLAIILGSIGCSKQGDLPAVKMKNVDQSTGFITVEGARLPYTIEGSGIPCVVTGYAKLIAPTFSRELRRHIQFIFADFRYAYGIEAKSHVEKTTLDTLVEDIEHIRKALGFKKIAVLGHSANGWIALEYARKYPQNTSHVIMIGAPLSFWSDEFRKKADKIWESEASEERKAILAKNWESLTQDMLKKVSPGKAFVMTYIANTPRYWYSPDYNAAPLWEGIEPNMDMYNQVYDVILKDFDVFGTVRQIKAPILAAIGRHDFWFYFPWDEKKDQLAPMTCVVFDKSAHFPEVEEQALFDQKLIDWIERH